MTVRCHVIFRHLSPCEMHGVRMGHDSVGPVLDDDGNPLVFDDLRSAVDAADRMDRRNRQGGDGIHCMNLRYTAGWYDLDIGEKA